MMWNFFSSGLAFTAPPFVIRPVIKVPPPTVILQHASENIWTEWVLPCVVAAAAVIAAVFAVLAFLKMNHQSRLQSKEIDLALETRDITKDQATKANDERAKSAKIVVRLNGQEPADAVEIVANDLGEAGLVPVALKVDAYNAGAKLAENVCVQLTVDDAIRFVANGSDDVFEHGVGAGTGHYFLFVEQDVIQPNRVRSMGHGQFEAPAGEYEIPYTVVRAESLGAGEDGTFRLLLKDGLASRSAP